MLKAIAAVLVAVSSASVPAQRGSSQGDALSRAIDRLHQRIAAEDIYVDHTSWEDPWVVETDHFSVRTTVSHAYGYDLAVGLENMLGHFHQALDTDFVPGSRFEVRIYPDLAAYNAFGENAAEHSSFYGSFYARGDAQRPVAALYNPNATFLRMQVTHSVVHQWLAAAHPGVSIPTWVDEGLAAYFSLYWGYEWGRQEFERLKAAGDLPDVRDLLRGGIGTYSPENHHARLMSLGMMFYYLLRFREDTRTVPATEGEPRAPFRDYLDAILRGQRPAASGVSELMSDPARLQRDLHAYEFPTG